MIPFLPYRSMRNHFLDYPLGKNMLTILVIAVIVGALVHGKRLPKSKLYLIWLVFGVYLYFSMWMGAALGNAPAPLWLSDINFVTWKDYMVIPLLFVATALVVEDRKAVRTVILITAFPFYSSTGVAYWRARREPGQTSTKVSATKAHWPLAQTKQQHSLPSSPCSFGASCNLSKGRK
jgi:hypothetical protein